MSEEHFKIVEINGVKLEIDLRTAKKVENFRVGERVKVLIKTYSESYTSHHGVIVGFDEFEELPTIIVCYVDTGHYENSIKFVFINTQTDNAEICHCDTSIMVEKDTIIEKINTEIQSSIAKTEDLERKKDYFLRHFGAYFQDAE